MSCRSPLDSALRRAILKTGGTELSCREEEKLSKRMDPQIDVLSLCSPQLQNLRFFLSFLLLSLHFKVILQK